jgi:hypothetical protein
MDRKNLNSYGKGSHKDHFCKKKLMKQLGENVIWSFSSLKLATLRQGQF